MNPITVLIADDHEVFRDGLKLMLRKEKDFSLVGEAANGEMLVEMAMKLQPQVILTDIKMPLMDGIAATQMIVSRRIKSNVLALSMYDDNELILEMLECGAKGYLQKNAGKEQICEAIRTVATGSNYYCNSTGTKLTQLLIKSEKFNPHRNNGKIEFTERELEAIRLICQNFSSKEIADKMFLSDRTVEGIKGKILEKTGASNTVGIVIYAAKNKLVKFH